MSHHLFYHELKSDSHLISSFFFYLFFTVCPSRTFLYFASSFFFMLVATKGYGSKKKCQIFSFCLILTNPDTP